MKSVIFILSWGLIGWAAANCSAALVPLPQGSVRVALINGDWPADTSAWVRTDEVLVDIFYTSATLPGGQFTPGQRVQLYMADQQIAKGILVARPDTHDVSEQRGIFLRSNIASPSAYERLIGWTAAPLTAGPDPLDPTIPYVGPLVSPEVVPEPAGLLIWSVAGGIGALGYVVRRRALFLRSKLPADSK